MVWIGVVCWEEYSSWFVCRIHVPELSRTDILAKIDKLPRLIIQWINGFTFVARIFPIKIEAIIEAISIGVKIPGLSRTIIRNRIMDRLMMINGHTYIGLFLSIILLLLQQSGVGQEFPIRILVTILTRQFVHRILGTFCRTTTTRRLIDVLIWIQNVHNDWNFRA